MMPPRRLLPVLALGVWAFLPSSALAAPKDDAKRYYIEGRAAFAAGDTATAVDRFREAYGRYPNPGVALALARALAADGQLEDALVYYAAYDRDKNQLPAGLQVDVTAEVDEVEGRLRAREQPAPVVDASPGAPRATAAELERLAAIAAELAELSKSIGTREDTVADATVDDSPAEPSESAQPTEAPLDAVDFFADQTVSASRYGQSLLDAPATVSVITADDIRLSGASTIPDVLRRVVGVDVMQLSAAQPDVSIRGFNRALSNKVLVLVDGRSVYQDILATPLWSAIPVVLEEIERIEVVRGPASAVYGANAVTGVINIITRAPGTGDHVVHVEGGTPDHARGSVLVSAREGDLAVRLSAGYEQLGRWSATDDVVEDGPIEGFFDNQAQSKSIVKAHGRIDRRLGDGALLSLSGGYAGGDSEFYVFGRLGDYALRFDSAFARADLTAGPVHARMFVNRFVADTGPWTSARGVESLDTYVDSSTWDGELEGNQRFEGDAVDHRLAGGVGYRLKQIDWGYLEGNGNPPDEHHFRVFVQEEAAIGPKRDDGGRPVSLVGSLRFDRHPLVPPSRTLSPRGAAVWRFAPRTAGRVSAGTAFRAPSQMESYLDLFQPVNGQDGVTVRTLGDRTLVPERVLTVEAGIHDESSDFHAADLTVYANQVSDLINLTDVDPAGVTDLVPDKEAFAAGTTSFTNLEEDYRGVGIEADTRLYPVDGLDLYANVAWGRIRLLSADPADPLLDESMSQVKVNVGTLVRTPWRTDLAVHASYLSAQTWRERDFDDNGLVYVEELPLPARTVLVARLATRPLPNEDLELGVTGWNLLALADGGFREHPLGQQVGPRVFGSATWRF